MVSLQEKRRSAKRDSLTGCGTAFQSVCYRIRACTGLRDHFVYNDVAILLYKPSTTGQPKRPQKYKIARFCRTPLPFASGKTLLLRYGSARGEGSRTARGANSSFSEIRVTSALTTAICPHDADALLGPPLAAGIWRELARAIDYTYTMPLGWAKLRPAPCDFPNEVDLPADQRIAMRVRQY